MSWKVISHVATGAQGVICMCNRADEEVKELLRCQTPQDAAQCKDRGFIAKIIRNEWNDEWFGYRGIEKHHRGALPEKISDQTMDQIYKGALFVQKELSHPNLITVVDLVGNSEAGEMMVVMPAFQMDLEDWLFRRRKNRVTEQMLLMIATQLASALSYLHKKNIWHLDVNAKNVLVSSKGDAPRVVLTDLETARLPEEDIPSAFTFQMAAPERNSDSSESRRGRVSDKCDTWSLGMLLFALGAHHEFPGIVPDVPSLGSVSMNHAQLTPSRIAAVVRRDLGHFSDGLVSLIVMMLNHDPETRPAMADVQSTLELLMSGSETPFPMSLGPFALRQCSAELCRCVDIYVNSQMCDVHGTCAKCDKRRSYDKNKRRTCSNGDFHMPAHTSASWQDGENGKFLPGFTTSRGVGSEDMYFMYPFMCDESRRAALWESSRLDELLQLQGGFCTTPKRNESISSFHPNTIVTLCPKQSNDGNVLYFSAAQPWPSECTTKLRNQGRIHTEVPSMLGTTAKCFCWILPKEQFTLSNGEDWMPSEDGAFVFWFNEDSSSPNSLDRYFSVSASVAKPEGVLDLPKQLFRKIFQGSTDFCGGIVDSCAHPERGRDNAPASPSAVSNQVVLLLRTVLDKSALTISNGSFTLDVSGESGTMHPPQYISEPMRSALKLPFSAQMWSFLQVTHQGDCAEERLLPYHGFAFFGTSPTTECIGYASLRIVTETDIDLVDFPMHLCTRIPTVKCEEISNATFESRRAEQHSNIVVADVNVLDTFEVTSREAGSDTRFFATAFAQSVAEPESLGSATWERLPSGGVGFIAFDVAQSRFFLAPQDQRVWRCLKIDC